MQNQLIAAPTYKKYKVLKATGCPDEEAYILLAYNLLENTRPESIELVKQCIQIGQLIEDAS